MHNNKDDSRIESFRYRVGIMQEWFKWYKNKPLYLDKIYFDVNVFTPDWCYESKNEYIKVILEELVPNEELQSSFGLLVLNSSRINKLPSLKSLLLGDSCTIYSKALGQPLEDEGTTIYCFDKNKVGTYEYRLIFWWLVILALDDTLYIKYLDYVVDAADIFGFTEDMMDDWCNAVIYWLNGNEINRKCRLQLKTNEGKLFFMNVKFTSNKENRQNKSNNEKGGLFETLNSLGYNIKI